jgi:flavin-binding protein dodecin
MPLNQTADSAACDFEAGTRRNNTMAKVVKVIELLSESTRSWEDAAQNAVSEANKTLRNIRSLYVKEMSAAVEGGKITQYRLNSKVSLELEGGRSGKK